jgi:hypothetical protein
MKDKASVAGRLIYSGAWGAIWFSSCLGTRSSTTFSRLHLRPQCNTYLTISSTAKIYSVLLYLFSKFRRCCTIHNRRPHGCPLILAANLLRRSLSSPSDNSRSPGHPLCRFRTQSRIFNGPEPFVFEELGLLIMKYRSPRAYQLRIFELSSMHFRLLGSLAGNAAVTVSSNILRTSEPGSLERKTWTLLPA